MTNNHVNEEGQSDPDQLLTSQRTYSVERTIQDSNFAHFLAKPETLNPRTPIFFRVGVEAAKP